MVTALKPEQPTAFRPPRLLQNGHVQSTLASLKLRARWINHRARALTLNQSFIELDAGDDVTLTGWYSAARDTGPLAILIHGWEGSAQSQYMLSTSAALFERGYRVMRFQLRDHGESHHLNEGLFHSCRLDEAVGGVAEIIRRFGNGEPVVLGGYSLGGNFSLRIGAAASRAGFQLAAIGAVCPVVVPRNTLDALEQTLSIYEMYFMRKWRRSLAKKRTHFPNTFTEDWITARASMRVLTARLVAHYGYMDLDNYLDGYRITGDRLAALAAPSRVLVAADDPIIPVADFDALRAPGLSILRTEHGGHCGYIDSLTGPTFADRFLVSWFDAHLEGRAAA
ncbi:MAG: alpha/beta fold hydrolase [Pseudomonadota bacterium]